MKGERDDVTQIKWGPAIHDNAIKWVNWINYYKSYPFKTKGKGQAFQESIGDEDFILMLKGGDV